MKKYNLAIIGLGVGEKVLKSLKNHKRIKKIKIFDFNKNIYSYRMNVEFINFIRAEKKFESLEKLKCQIIKDIEQARNDGLFKNN